jgi:hypothetical protein
MGLEELVDVYIWAKRKQEKLKRHKAGAEVEFRQAESELAKFFVDDNTDVVRKASEGAPSYRRGALFSLAQKFQISLTEANTEAIIEWIVGRGCEKADYVKDKLVYRPTKALLHTVYKDEGEFALPGGSGDMINLSTVPGISVTGWNEHYKEIDD